MSDPDLFGNTHPSSDEVDATRLVGTSWQPTPWWGWTLALLGLATLSLLGAGAMLSSAEFGTSLRARGCDPSALPGLGMLALGGLLAGLALQTARLRWPDSYLVWDAGSLVLSLPIPAALLVATLPGVLGCAAGRDIARLDVLGDPLVGTAGIALCAAASVLVGVAIAGSAHVGWVAAHGGGSEQPPGIVELAMAEAEALEAEGASSRFRGVEPVD